MDPNKPTKNWSQQQMPNHPYYWPPMNYPPPMHLYYPPNFYPPNYAPSNYSPNFMPPPPPSHIYKPEPKKPEERPVFVVPVKPVEPKVEKEKVVVEEGDV